MQERLKQVLEMRRAEGRDVHIFFRVDDIDQNDATLRRLLGVFLRMNTPVSLAVIPARLSRKAIDLLRAKKRHYPALIELNQHGWQHINHERDGRECEFGASRTFEEQLRDIAEGYRVMTEAFGDHWTRVFIPPWNRCNRETLRALARLGFVAISKEWGKTPTGDHKFQEFSITLDLFIRRTEAVMKDPSHFLAELVMQIREAETIGIQLDSKYMDAAALTFLEQLIQTLRIHPHVRFHTFQSLLDRRTGGGGLPVSQAQKRSVCAPRLALRGLPV